MLRSEYPSRSVESTEARIRMIHGGEGEAGTGEVCRGAGSYRSLCCRGEIRGLS